MTTFAERLVGAAKLDIHIYEEVEADTTATGQAMVVVILASVAAGFGAIRYIGPMGVVRGTVVSLVAWFVWALLTFLIGTKALPEPQTRSDVAELLRTTGFASSPGLLRVLGVIPILGFLINLVVSIWMLIAMVIAIRQALDYTSTARTIVVVLIGFVAYVGLSMLLLPFGPQ